VGVGGRLGGPWGGAAGWGSYWGKGGLGVGTRVGWCVVPHELGGVSSWEGGGFACLGGHIEYRLAVLS